VRLPGRRRRHITDGWECRCPFWGIAAPRPAYNPGVDEDRFERGVAALGSLHDPARRALYRYVAVQSHDVGRDEAARAVGVQRGLAAFHLDKLVDAGLLEVAAVRRVSGRSGPGAGRPAKLYRRAAVQHQVSVPERTYELAASLLAEAVDEAGVEPTLYAAARRLGVRAGRQEPEGTGVAEVLARRGYEPYRDGAALRLGNCPFRDVAGQFPAVVCGMNLALLEGLLDGIGADGAAVLDPAPGRCCVAVVR
jgi:predicted ArsR family transcriptional regulator